jgi:hypothetical protein
MRSLLCIFAFLAPDLFRCAVDRRFRGAALKRRAELRLKTRLGVKRILLWLIVTLVLKIGFVLYRSWSGTT